MWRGDVQCDFTYKWLERNAIIAKYFAILIRGHFYCDYTCSWILVEKAPYVYLNQILIYYHKDVFSNQEQNNQY